MEPALHFDGCPVNNTGNSKSFGSSREKSLGMFSKQQSDFHKLSDMFVKVKICDRVFTGS